MAKKHKQAAQIEATAQNLAIADMVDSVDSGVPPTPEEAFATLIEAEKANRISQAEMATLAKATKVRKEKVSEVTYRLAIPASAFTSDSKQGPCLYLPEGLDRYCYIYTKGLRVEHLTDEAGQPIMDRKGSYPALVWVELPHSRIQAMGPKAVARSVKVETQAEESESAVATA